MEQIFSLPTYLGILISASYTLGYFLKYSKIKDKWIPFIILPFSITFAILLTIINENYMVDLKTWTYGVLYGILSWGTAIGINQSVKQFNKQE